MSTSSPDPVPAPSLSSILVLSYPSFVSVSDFNPDSNPDVIPSLVLSCRYRCFNSGSDPGSGPVPNSRFIRIFSPASNPNLVLVPSSVWSI